MTIDFERLRHDLMDYYGTAMTNGFPIAVMDLGNVEHASSEKLLQLAKDAHFDLNHYLVDHI